MSKNTNIYIQTGGSDNSISKSELFEIGNILTEYLLYLYNSDNYGNGYLDSEELQPLKSVILSLTGQFEIEGIIELILTKYQVIIPNYIKYMKIMNYGKEKQHIYQFLKIQKEQNTILYPIRSQTMLKARKLRKSRITRKSRKSKTFHK